MYNSHFVVGGIASSPTIGVVHSVDIKFGDLITNFSLVDWPMNTKDTSTMPS